ncbi:MAG: quinolinate synthase NadA [Candidatus Thorarchaeota archaeon]|nr:quinolinate synthase NadA [Candidatus Thorarchaeota archaeon]
MTDAVSDLQQQILDLKKERNALILAHNYQVLENQHVADFVGSSLQLARKSAEMEGYDMVVFAGVMFMAETASILSDIPVYIPEPNALCPLAAMNDPEKIRAKKKEHPDAPVVVYVNTTAETKAVADIVCTSSNAVEVVESLGSEKVIFGPDANLAEYVRRRTDVEVIDVDTEGHCFVHRRFDVDSIRALKEDHPEAIVLAHPECSPAVQDIADKVCSTGGMVRTVSTSPKSEFIIATEIGLVHRLQEDHPNKVIIPALETAVCRRMKLTTLEKILAVLQDRPEENRVVVPPAIAESVRVVLERMNRVQRSISP